MNCLLLRQMRVRLAMRLWDTYFSEESGDFGELHVYVCAALLAHYSPTLLQLREFQDVVMFLQVKSSERVSARTAAGSVRLPRLSAPRQEITK